MDRQNTSQYPKYLMYDKHNTLTLHYRIQGKNVYFAAVKFFRTFLLSIHTSSWYRSKFCTTLNIQSSAVIKRCNISWYYTQQYNDREQNINQISKSQRTPHTSPLRWDMGVFREDFGNDRPLYNGTAQWIQYISIKHVYLNSDHRCCSSATIHANGNVAIFWRKSFENFVKMTAISFWREQFIIIMPVDSEAIDINHQFKWFCTTLSYWKYQPLFMLKFGKTYNNQIYTVHSRCQHSYSCIRITTAGNDNSIIYMIQFDFCWK